MRTAGWAKLGYYPTPDRVTDMIASQTSNALYHPMLSSRSGRERTEPRTFLFDPCCGEGNAIARFADLLEHKAKQCVHFGDGAIFRTYGVELHQERAQTARRQLTRVWNTDIDNARIRPDSYHYLWLNPPYDWSEDEDQDGSRRLESRFLHHATWGLTPNGILIYIIPRHVLRHDARFLSEHYRSLRVFRFPDPEYADYRQVVVFGQRREYPQYTPGISGIADDLARMAAPHADIRELEFDDVGLYPAIAECRAVGYPVRVMEHTPEVVAQAAQSEGLWHSRAIRSLLSTEPEQTRIRPIEPLPEGHAAMVAANSMMDNVIIRDPTEGHDPIVLRGFFRKRNQETFRSSQVAVRTDYFESNIRALNTRTGQIDEVGSDPAGLQQFMDIYGPVIREHIAAAYPPSVDPASPLCQAIRERIVQVKRPLLGKQLEAAVTGAAYLKKNKHLNLFFMQGAGKTCTSFAIAYGMGASKVAVMTPTRVIPNWVSEIRSVWPDAIIRVVRNDRRIGTRRPPTESELSGRPAAYGRASLEEIRRLESWATPETPLWILMKKDTARASHPTAHGLRYIGNTGETEPFRPLRALARAEKRAKAKPMPTAGNSAPSLRRLYRDQHGKLSKMGADAKPVGVCPECWYPLTTDDKWNPKDRDAVCINPGLRPAPGQQRQPEGQDDEPDAGATVSCNAPIGAAVRDARGRAIYSYGDYASRYLGKWLDLLIIDEVQDYKGKGTAQGGTTRRMAQRARKTLALTGTPFGGKVSEVFYLLVSLNPGFARHFNYQDLGAFLRAYGREETTYDLHDDPSASVGVASRRRETKQNVKEIPGYHPALLEHFWHNTIFASIHDIDPERTLPPLRQRAELIELSDREQGTDRGNYSQASAYHELDMTMTEHLKAYLQVGSRRPLGQYLHEMLTYPENCWQGTQPCDPDTGDPIITMPPLSDQVLYPKERKLLDLLAGQKARKRKCLVYATHTSRRDTTERLMGILRQDGYRALQLKAGTVDSEARAQWLSQQARLNDVIICHPRLVETGVNLLDYPTIIWYEIEYSMYTTEQASARSYRINQTRPVEVYYLAYADTMQERALRIIARKADVSRTFHGDLSKNGLSAFNPDPDDIRDQLARQLLARNGRNGANGHHAKPDTDDLNQWLSEKDLAGNGCPDEPTTKSVLAVPAEPPEVSKQWNNAGATQLSLLFG